MASVITNLLGGNLLDGVSKVINSIRGKNPEDAAKLEALRTQYETEFLQAQADLAKAQIAENVDLNKIAGENIRAEQGDKFTGRARPSVIWMGNLLLIWNYALVPTFGLHWHLQPITLPDAFWWTWGTVVTGYVFARTAQNVSTTLLGGQGGSAQFPFGIKVDSKGDK